MHHKKLSVPCCSITLTMFKIVHVELSYGMKEKRKTPLCLY